MDLLEVQILVINVIFKWESTGCFSSRTSALIVIVINVVVDYAFHLSIYASFFPLYFE